MQRSISPLLAVVAVAFAPKAAAVGAFGGPQLQVTTISGKPAFGWGARGVARFDAVVVGGEAFGTRVTTVKQRGVEYDASMFGYGAHVGYLGLEKAEPYGLMGGLTIGTGSFEATASQGDPARLIDVSYDYLQPSGGVAFNVSDMLLVTVEARYRAAVGFEATEGFNAKAGSGLGVAVGAYFGNFD